MGREIVAHAFELDELRVGVDAVRAADPDALVYVNFSYIPDEGATSGPEDSRRPARIASGGTSSR